MHVLKAYENYKPSLRECWFIIGLNLGDLDERASQKYPLEMSVVYTCPRLKIFFF